MDLECSVCLEENYVHNNFLTCNHPLCLQCYIKLDKKICPICRNEKKYLHLELNLNGSKYFINEKNLIFFVFSYSYTIFMKNFILNRRKNKIIKNVNRYLQQDFFIYDNKKNNIIHLSNNKEDFYDYILNNKISKNNKEIIKILLLKK